MAFSRGREKKCNSVFYVVTSVCSKQSGPTRHQTIFGVVSLSYFQTQPLISQSCPFCKRLFRAVTPPTLFFQRTLPEVCFLV